MLIFLANNLAESTFMFIFVADLKTRIIGFIISFFLGIFMMISSISQLFTLALGGQRLFAIWYTCGNIVCLSSTFFLMGPKKQCENMMKPQRKCTS